MTDLGQRIVGADRAFALLKSAIERAVKPAALPGGKQGSEALEEVEAALLGAATLEPVVLALDDIQWADAQTLGLLELLIERAELGAMARLLVVATARDEPNPSPALRALLAAVRKVSGPIPLSARNRPSRSGSPAMKESA